MKTMSLILFAIFITSAIAFSAFHFIQPDGQLVIQTDTIQSNTNKVSNDDMLAESLNTQDKSELSSSISSADLQFMYERQNKLDDTVEQVILHNEELQATISNMQKQIDALQTRKDDQEIIRDIAATTNIDSAVITQAIQAYEQHKVDVAKQQQEEFKQMQKGPYGNYNYKVNTAAKQADMSDFQITEYHKTLIKQAESTTELYAWYKEEIVYLTEHNGNNKSMYTSSDYQTLVKEYQERNQQTQDDHKHNLQSFLSDEQIGKIVPTNAYPTAWTNYQGTKGSFKR